MKGELLTGLYAASLVLAMTIAGCGGDEKTGTDDTESSDTEATADADAVETGFVPPIDFGDACRDNAECESGWCVPAQEGNVCTGVCTSECPAGYGCRGVFTSSGAATFLCMPEVHPLCTPCVEDADCDGGGVAGACVTLDTEPRCAFACGDDDDCPTGFSCAADPDGERPGTWCVPATGSCTCNALISGGFRPCIAENTLGRCQGVQLCKGASGWLTCSAPTPAAETCDGVDNDCNGQVDDGLDELVACDNTVEGVGSCTGVHRCLGAAGWFCDGPRPEAELCDGADNDCDGATDEDFKDGDGAFTLEAHCGYCFNDCAGKIPNGVGRCGGEPGEPACVIDHCDAGFVPVNAFQCVRPIDVGCQPCVADLDCFGGRCVSLDGAKHCVMPCGDGSACADGYKCGQVDGVASCTPLSGTCTCTPANAGQLRGCTKEAAAGVCAGFETCVAELGWTGCTAPTPAAEVCDGRDNDCDGVYDEDFRDAGGAWTLTAHCGSCGNDCAERFPNGTGTCGGDAGAPLCVVASCDPGFLHVSDFQCIAPPDVSCQPCVGDGDCYDGSCVPVDGQDVCVMPCAAPDETCGPGYACATLPGDLRRCMPLTATCSCVEATAGSTRTCVATNAHGTCIGQEACEPDVGWFGCTAAPPEPEVCNGLDDDCDGLIDVGAVPPTAACEASNDFGVCAGAWRCEAGDAGTVAWRCHAPEPAADVCDLADNDCDGQTDEDFRDGPGGPYVDDQHCGACGVSCDGAIPNATAACGLSGGAPRCLVAACDAGFFQAGPLACLPVQDALCVPCESDANCPTAGDRCLTLGDGSRACGRDCGADNAHGIDAGVCPEGYACEAVGNGQQCVPVSGTCSCLPGDEGETRHCAVSNAAGTCSGVEHCDPMSGWVGCTAATPVVETCDGTDQDCDGQTDEGVVEPTTACEATNTFGTCSGTWRCAADPAGAVAWRCEAPAASADVCDLADNDCDGLTDEDFRDGPGGAYVDDQNCGACGVSCAGAIPNATATCALTGGVPRCVVASCDEGWFRSGDFACLPVQDALCVPCQTDANCPTAGDVCLTLDDGSRACGRDCSADNVHGVAAGVCPEGYACEAVGDGQQCVPVSGTCSCLPGDEGETRHCAVSNAAGTCSGVEHCDPTSGWVGCTAATPVVETCDGTDQDCDGQTDEGVVAPTTACEATNTFGTCSGTWRCAADPAGAVAWRCEAPAASADVCDLADNDCDGLTDEDFRDGPGGAYVDDQNCGACGVSCAGAIPNATATCALTGGVPRCVVASCDEGWFRSGDFACLPVQDALCVPCQTDANCPTAGDVCLTLDDGSRACGRDCSADNVHGVAAGVCPEGYACEAVGDGQQCVPVSGTCSCLPGDEGETRHCAVSNAAGTCSGVEHCDPTSGWVGCTAATPVVETCDGTDQDCDGQTDEGVVAPTTACEATNTFGTCSGTWRCAADPAGAVAWRCEAPAASADVCDLADNDCDGLTDEDFRDGPGGAYVDDQNCGACGVSCAGAIPNATATCALTGGVPRCVVASCDDGWFRASDFACLPVQDSLCVPCETDANCPTAGDVCLTLDDGTRACGRDCSAGNVHGSETCPQGYACEAVGASEQCVPTSGTCSCLPENDGELRPCAVENDAGRCLGVEACDGALGWSACSAPTPVAEVCNGEDDDCSGLIDDVVGRGDGCTIANDAGSCPGVRDCAGSAALVCVGPTPAEEVCDGRDNDCDGDIDAPLALPACPLDKGVCEGATQLCAGSLGLLACNAGSYGAYYEVTEVSCDGRDNDCDGVTDGIDLDRDGYVDAACGGDDCDDINPLVHPGAAETCGDAIDNDCNGETDDKDEDLDQHIDEACVDYTGLLPVDDCEDDEILVNTEAVEVCGDGVDNDCDGSVDNLDADGDKFLALACDGTDCDDDAADVHPGSVEVCDGKDNECNGVIDDKDADVDGHVDVACVLYAGSAPRDDCDDANVGVRPGVDEVCGNGLDEDCSGALNDRDVDGDGFVDVNPLCGGTDCDDGHPLVYPGAPEVRDGRDNDCDADGVADEGLVGAGALVITEILFDSSQSPDENYEWFEVFNPTDRPVDMAGWHLRDQPSSAQEVAIINRSVVVPPKGFGVLCRTGSPEGNGGVLCDYEYGFMQLGNSADELILDFAGAIVDEVWYGGGWPSPTGASIILDPDDYASNNNTAGPWCAHPAGIAIPDGDLGSPGVSNVSCTAPIDEPQVTSVWPSDAPAAGGVTVRIGGAGFLGTTDVRVGGQACASFTVESDATLTCELPAGSAGATTVEVVEGGASDVLVGGLVLTREASNGSQLIDAARIVAPEETRFVRGTWSPVLVAEVEENSVTGGGCPAAGEYAPGQLRVSVGLGAAYTDPRTDPSWVWWPAFCASTAGGVDTFHGTVTASAPGDFAAVYRVSRDGGVSWVYVDTDGTANGFDAGGAVPVLVQ